MHSVFAVLIFAICSAAQTYENVILVQREKTTGATVVQFLGEFVNSTGPTLDISKEPTATTVDEVTMSMVIIICAVVLAGAAVMVSDRKNRAAS